MSANLPPLPSPVANLCTSLYPRIVIEPGGFSADQMRAYATAAISAQAAELEALRDELRLCCELKREYQEQVASKVDEVEALRKRAETWELLYMRAINEANGLTNYVEDRPELPKIERKLVAIEAAARAALKEQTPNVGSNRPWPQQEQ